MSLKLINASPEHKAIIENLMQFYMYDFSEFIQKDVSEKGVFESYPDLENYWQDMHRYPYLIVNGEKYVGFVLVRYIEIKMKNYFSIAEFFIMKKYRRKGYGRIIAEQVFHRHKGNWEVFAIKANRPAQLFWQKTIREYTKGKFTERWENGKSILDFEN
jgi:predicted acetyltransferase